MSNESASSKFDPMTVQIESMTAGQLEELVHTLTATRLIQMLRSPESCTPALLQAALRFLVENGVTGLNMPGSKVDEVREAMKDKVPFRLAE